MGNPRSSCQLHLSIERTVLGFDQCVRDLVDLYSADQAGLPTAKGAEGMPAYVVYCEGPNTVDATPAA